MLHIPILRGGQPYRSLDTIRTVHYRTREPFARLAAGMTDNVDAITNAFHYPRSTGPVEGHITRVKLIKRAGYGRAKLPLLRARILGPN